MLPQTQTTIRFNRLMNSSAPLFKSFYLTIKKKIDFDTFLNYMNEELFEALASASSPFDEYGALRLDRIDHLNICGYHFYNRTKNLGSKITYLQDDLHLEVAELFFNTALEPHLEQVRYYSSNQDDSAPPPINPLDAQFAILERADDLRLRDKILQMSTEMAKIMAQKIAQYKATIFDEINYRRIAIILYKPIEQFKDKELHSYFIERVKLAGIFLLHPQLNTPNNRAYGLKLLNYILSRPHASSPYYNAHITNGFAELVGAISGEPCLSQAETSFINVIVKIEKEFSFDERSQRENIPELPYVGMATAAALRDITKNDTTAIQAFIEKACKAGARYDYTVEIQQQESILSTPQSHRDLKEQAALFLAIVYQYQLLGIKKIRPLDDNSAYLKKAYDYYKFLGNLPFAVHQRKLDEFKEYETLRGLPLSPMPSLSQSYPAIPPAVNLSIASGSSSVSMVTEPSAPSFALLEEQLKQEELHLKVEKLTQIAFAQNKEIERHRRQQEEKDRLEKAALQAKIQDQTKAVQQIKSEVKVIKKEVVAIKRTLQDHLAEVKSVYKEEEKKRTFLSHQETREFYTTLKNTLHNTIVLTQVRATGMLVRNVKAEVLIESPLDLLATGLFLGSKVASSIPGVEVALATASALATLCAEISDEKEAQRQSQLFLGDPDVVNAIIEVVAQVLTVRMIPQLSILSAKGQRDLAAQAAKCIAKQLQQSSTLTSATLLQEMFAAPKLHAMGNKTRLEANDSKMKPLTYEGMMLRSGYIAEAGDVILLVTGPRYNKYGAQIVSSSHWIFTQPPAGSRVERYAPEQILTLHNKETWVKPIILSQQNQKFELVSQRELERLSAKHGLGAAQNSLKHVGPALTKKN